MPTIFRLENAFYLAHIPAMQTKCPNCSATVKSSGDHWEIIGGPCPELAGTYLMEHPEYCPTLSHIAEPDIVLPGKTSREKVEAEIIRVQFGQRAP